jgi:polyhydroxybutyrate depolymerase
MTWGVSGVDDVQFFMDILDDVTSNAAVDSSRVYVNGFSNGGGMTVYLGCEASQVIAAMGTVAGAVVENKDCDVSHPIPVMAFHGTGDPVVPYQGGEMEYRLLRWGANITDAPIYFIGAADWTARWAQLNGCAPVPEEISTQGDVSGIRYTDCLDDAEVVFYTIDGGGHTWPGGMPLVITGKTSNDIDATEELWRFFQKYQLEQ